MTRGEGGRKGDESWARYGSGDAFTSGECVSLFRSKEIRREDGGNNGERLDVRGIIESFGSSSRREREKMIVLAPINFFRELYLANNLSICLRNLGNYG